MNYEQAGLMLNIHFPYHPFKIKSSDGKEIIFDEARKKWVSLTPEEWVRQNLLQYLVHIKNIPLKWIAVEKQVQIGDIKKRFDIVVMNASMQPHILIECKAPGIILNDDVLQQALSYHLPMPAAFLVLSNGNKTYAWKKTGTTLELMDEFPSL